MPDIGYPGYRILNAGYRIPRIQDIKCWIQDIKCWIQDTQDIGYQTMNICSRKVLDSYHFRSMFSFLNPHPLTKGCTLKR